ncbi:MAG: histidinol dehydrogenase [Bacteroidetes bacterium HGW-Bacteroidetes-8]|jgi:histidinol dehydrogenase|nr:MAG: histidinol dehydrogenase [Bacteroidetes bacterium HGW-Bacteroidetes-8]
MKIIEEPQRGQWAQLAGRSTELTESIEKRVSGILSEVRTSGDIALYELTQKIDGVFLKSLYLDREFIDNSKNLIEQELKNAIDIAAENIERFHRAQVSVDIDIITTPGVRCIQRSLPIERVGLYIPGGSAPLFSTVLMLGIPAKIAGCREIVLFTPPSYDGKIPPVLAYTASRIGIDTIVTVGGAQAVAAMAYGTESIKRVDKIFGPGNQYVTIAKQMVSKTVAIDMVAGPSELMVIADSSCDAGFIAADLLSQAEHGLDSQVILLVPEKSVADKVMKSVQEQRVLLDRKREIEGSLMNSRVIIFKEISNSIEFANLYAPEHLIIATQMPWEIADKIRAAGSIFIGEYSPESAGDYASGTNHTLPTGGWARSSGGLSLESFTHKITYQELTPQGLLNLGPHIATMAQNEQLQGHRNAVEIRLKRINSGN